MKTGTFQFPMSTFTWKWQCNIWLQTQKAQLTAETIAEFVITHLNTETPRDNLDVLSPICPFRPDVIRSDIRSLCLRQKPTHTRVEKKKKKEGWLSHDPQPAINLQFGSNILGLRVAVILLENVQHNQFESSEGGFVGCSVGNLIQNYLFSCNKQLTVLISKRDTFPMLSGC